MLPGVVLPGRVRLPDDVVGVTPFDGVVVEGVVVVTVPAGVLTVVPVELPGDVRPDG